MKYLLFIVLATDSFSDPLTDRKAEWHEVGSTDTPTSTPIIKQRSTTYKFMIDSMEVEDDNVALNLANCYFLSKDTAQAKQQYQLLNR